MVIVRGVPQAKDLMSFTTIYHKFCRQSTIQKGNQCAAGENFDDFLSKTIIWTVLKFDTLEITVIPYNYPHDTYTL